MTRRPPQPPRSVCFDVPDGHGVIEVIGDEGGSLLLLAGEPVVLEVNDGCGSLGWLAARAGTGGPGLSEVKYLTEWLGAPGLVPDPLTGRAGPPDPQCLRPLLSLLAPGRYVMSAGLAPHDLRVVRPRALQVQSWYADEELALVTSGAWPPRDHRAVRGYVDRIRAGGGLPALVALFPTAGSSVGHLLDGHHKLAAYERAGARPLVIRLAPQEPRPFRRDDLDRARAAFSDGAPRPQGDALGRLFSSVRTESA
ncbi:MULTISPECIES: hypothetical protein [unclassified Streptomyces]|uniref:hypothetical protein n=1 Tax=unclassified Streptomyces TaxID=2593676 RepID=UPI00131B6F0D|nr:MULTISPECIES: hypothetical protein [unclassified Streptomyces]